MTKLMMATLLYVFTATAAADDGRVVVDFGKPGTAALWRTVNDGVMGGRSDGRAKINAEKNLEFYGTLSLENNGGFASVRGRVERAALTQKEIILLRVRGDGREYNFNLYTQSNLSGYSYRQSFKTERDEWIEVRLPMDKFVATWRGRRFPDEELRADKVAGMGILLGDKRPGSFKLEVDWIKAVPAKVAEQPGQDKLRQSR